MSNFNIDENTVNKLKDMMDKGNLSDVISQIPPDVMQNFSSMMNQNNNSQNQPQNQSQSQNAHHTTSEQTQTTSNNSNNGFDFSNIDMNTIMKMSSVMNNLNNSNDPRSNLLQSLKPYLREGRKEKVDQYANLLNVAKIAELLRNDNSSNPNKESPNHG